MSHTFIFPAAPKTDEEEEQERADQAKCIGAILCGVAACVFGYAYNIYTRQQETMTRTQEVHTQVRDENWLPPENEFVERVHVITEEQLQIDALNTSRVNNYALAALIFLVAAGFIVAGGSWLQVRSSLPVKLSFCGRRHRWLELW